MKTKTYNLTKSALVLILLAFGFANSMAQSFPDVWKTDEYDYEHGSKGRLFVINTDDTDRNKAYIFSTGISNNNFKDLFRLTSEGVTTFNAPRENTEVQLNFYNQGLRQGELSGSLSTLRVIGARKLDLGTLENYGALEIETDNITAGTDFLIDHDNIILRLGVSDNFRNGWIGTDLNDKLVLGTGRRNILTLDGLERVAYIGLSVAEADAISPAYKRRMSLFVKKGILSEDYVIAPIDTWSDKVFAPDYNLKSLNEVKTFITEHGHLPEVPSADDVAKNGYSQHDMNKILLQKIEELTLYIMDQKEEIESLKAQIK